MNAITMNNGPVGASVESTPFDEETARREGWVISGCGVDDSGLPRVELQRLDNPGPGEGTFPDDCDAWSFVAGKAVTGSRLHLEALAMVDPIERALITRHHCRS